MRSATPANRFPRLFAAAAMALAGLPALASADTIVIGGTKFPPATIQDIKDGQLTYKNRSSGEVREVEASRVQKMLVDGETTLNAAEEAFEKKDWAAAMADYKRAAASPKPFVKTRAITRMLEAAANTKQFEAQVGAFAELAKLDPAAAAKQPKIALPADKAKLKAVLPVLDQAATARRSPVLESFIVEVALEAGDIAMAKKWGGGVAPPPPVQPPRATGVPGVPGTPEDAGPAVVPPAQAIGRINQAKIALASKNPAGAIQAIEAANGRTAFTTAATQFEALTILADARGQLARDAKTAQEAAVAYMTIVAHARALGKENDPAVAEAMLQAAGLIETKVGQPKEALTLYNTLATDKRWDGTAAGDAAKKAVARLKAAASAG